MNTEVKNKWNNIYAESIVSDGSISQVLLENQHLLPEQGQALDLACGKGADAIFLANKGLNVDAWDISDGIIQKISTYAKVQNLTINAEARDIHHQPPMNNVYDVICVAHYLERDLMPALIQSLKPNGLIFYQTFTQVVTPNYSGPRNLAFRLAENELLTLFSDLQLVVYREDALIGNLEQGFRNEVMYVGQKKL